MDAVQSAVFSFLLAIVTLALIVGFFVPFWKVKNYIRDHQPDIWDSKGPFTFSFMLNNPSIIVEFAKLMGEIAQDESLLKADAELVKKSRLCHEIIKLLPKSFLGQIGIALIFFYFDILFATLLFKVVY